MGKPTSSSKPSLPNDNPNNLFEVLPSPTDGVSSLSFSPKANYLVATSWDNQVLCSAWKDDDTVVFLGGFDKQVKLWPLATGAQPITIAMHDAPVKGVAWISEMNLLVSSSWDKTIRYWDCRQAQPAHIQLLPDKCLAMAVNFPLMVVGSTNRNLIVYELKNPQTEYKLIVSPLKHLTRCLATFPDKQGFLVGSIEGRVGVQHLTDSAKDFTFKCHQDANSLYAVDSLSLHPVHQTFATTGADGTFNCWDKNRKQRLKIYPLIFFSFF